MITGKVLKARGWKEGRTVGAAKIAAHHLISLGHSQDEVLEKLDAVLENPSAFLADPTFFTVASELIARSRSDKSKIADALRETPLEFPIWGAGEIEEGALTQMRNAMRLPVSVAGSLMPDAHVGYGLPIGGVLATKDTVIPYAVGVDIACRMKISIFEQSPAILGQHKLRFENALRDQTRFGAGVKWGRHERKSHEVLDDHDGWNATGILRSLRGKAEEQLGTSGSGNHFVEWGEFELKAPSAELGLEAGKYLALLSHSGSRGIGHKIATEFSRLASSLHPELADVVKHLAWLDLDTDAGREYCFRWSRPENSRRPITR